MKTKITPGRTGLLAVVCAIALGSWSVPTTKAQPKPGGLFAPPNVGAPKTRVGSGVRVGLPEVAELDYAAAKIKG